MPRSPKQREKVDDERWINLMTVVEKHITADAAAFQELAKQILEVNGDVKSLLASRSFLRGAWFALGVSATVLMGAMTLWLTYFK